MDFTLSKYRLLLKTLQDKGYKFVTFYDYLKQKQSFSSAVHEGLVSGQSSITQDSQPEPSNSALLIILRHDVDLKPHNSLVTAKIEHGLGIRGSYYFRIVPESFNVKIIKEIASLGHEVGYHYETMDTVAQKTFHRPSSDGHGNVSEAYQLFVKNLETFRQIADIKTICMHGSPKSKYDNREIWQKYDYRHLGIIGEPYFDIDFNEFFYLTDTGRRWDGHRVSIRDKMPQQEKWDNVGLRFASTDQLFRAAGSNILPQKIMITVHPQRWSSSFFPWAQELLWQNAKNIIKGLMVYSTKR